MPLPFYPDLAETDDPASGLSAHGVLAALLHRLFSAAQPLHGAGRDAFLEGLCDARARHPQHDRGTRASSCCSTASQWRELARAGGSRDAARLGGSEVVLDYSSGWREAGAGGAQPTPAAPAATQLIDFPGYAYTRDAPQSAARR